MILTDTGPLVALLDRNDSRHAECMAAARGLPAGPLLTTWPCFTEAMYLLGAVGGFRYQEELWRLRQGGRLLLHDLTSDQIDRMAILMKKYRDRPMDLADASLLVVAEARGIRPIFTTDSDFHIYRFIDGSAPDRVP